MWSGVNLRKMPFAHLGAQEEYQVSTLRHSVSGLRTMSVSIMENGAGSVDVSARPALPKTRSTSGTVLMTRSICCSSFSAPVTDKPGKVVGMYRMVPSLRGGINSDPNRKNTGMVTKIKTPEAINVHLRYLRTKRQAGSSILNKTLLMGCSSSG